MLTHKGTQTIETSRLILRRAIREDAEPMFRNWASDPEVAFISNDIVIMTMQQCQGDYLMNGDYNKETFRLDDFPFVFHTPDHCRELLGKAGIHICHEVAADGVSELLKDLVNTMDTATYQQYLRYHFYICEKPECLGMSNHLLFVGKKE